MDDKRILSDMEMSSKHIFCARWCSFEIVIGGPLTIQCSFFFFLQLPHSNRALRELTSITATSGGRYGGGEDHGKSELETPGRVGGTKQGLQTRAGVGGRSISGRPTRRCGYESMMVSTIRHEEAQRAKEEKR